MQAIPYLAFVLLVLGAKFLLIAAFGNATPYWDQWDAEADLLYRPFLEGTLRWQELFAAHNEHRIFTTRIVALLLFILNNNSWNPLLQMIANATIHVFALTLLLYFFAHDISQKFKLSVFIFAAFLFAIPYGYENTLAGFQTQFYLLVLFSLLFLWALVRYEPLSGTWWLGLLCGVLSCLSLASGALTLAAGMGLIVGYWFTGIRRDKIHSLLFLALLCGFVFMVYITPSIPAHAALKAKSFTAYLFAIGKIISWPAVIPAGLLIYTPMFFFLYKQLKEKPLYNAVSWFFFALSLWIMGQIFSIGYGRAVGVFSSRYLDIFALGVLLNFFFLLRFMQQKNISSTLAAVWVMIIFLGLGVFTTRAAFSIQQKAEQSQQQEKNVRAYLLTKDRRHLENKPDQYIPYAHAERLKNLLDSSTIQKILPKNLTSIQTENIIFAKLTPQKMAVGFSILLIFTGLGLFFLLRIES